MISVEFEQSSYLVNEKAGYIEICLLSSGQNNADIIVNVQPQEAVPVSARGMCKICTTLMCVCVRAYVRACVAVVYIPAYR